MRRSTRMPTAVLLVAATALVTACAGGSSPGDGDAVVAPADPTTTLALDDAVGRSAGDETATAADATMATEWTVALEVSASGVAGGGFATGGTRTVGSESDGDPFDSFASCSGLRTWVGAYSVFLSGTDDESTVSVWTPDRVEGAGIYDAEVRVERRGEVHVGTGTMTILDGMQAGEFLAFVADGGRIEGTFSCQGAAPPAVLRPGDPSDGVLETLEVFSLVRQGEAERVAGLTAAPTDADLACPAAEGADQDALLARVDGGPTLGAITAFELTSTTMRVRVGSVTYEFDDVVVELADDGRSGSFTATAPDGTSVDGAFRCT